MSTARDGLLNHLTGRSLCPPPRPVNEAIELLDAYASEIRAEVLREVADMIRTEFPDPNPLASVFKPYLGDRIAACLLSIADETEHQWAEEQWNR